MSKLVIPPDLRERQVTASDPARSIWVSANAGSGKTHVLTQRVIRLLLSGVAPSKILCLTFTKAAAAQMATRVFQTLSQWTTLGDAKLKQAILETGAPTPSAVDLLLARRLFTRTIETPGGLKIQTIHAFCERLLHLFPFEANVPARFAVADDLRTQEMLSQAKRIVIAQAQREPGPLGAALTLVADLVGSAGIDGLLGAAMKLRAKGAEDRQRDLPGRLGAGNLVSVTAVQKAMIEDGIVPARWPELALVFDQGGTNDRKQAERLRAAAGVLDSGDPTAPTQALDHYLSVFFTDDGPRKTLMNAALAKIHPAIKLELEAEKDRLVGLKVNLARAEAIERTGALLLLADATLARYRVAKIAAGLLDFDDLIDRTLALLDRSASGWILHKLDAGIDHVLVDEAQDTSETQWRILENLTHDFATGLGGRAQTRSFFVVGDDKQSIFSFQGAAPLMFDAMRSTFERRFREGQKPFERVSLKTSFRSTPGILRAVDALFEMEGHQDGLVRKPDVWPGHESIKSALPSLVEIWPAFGATAAANPSDWSIPLDVASEQDPSSVVADRVARKIAMLIAPSSGEYVHDGRGDRQRPIQASDILILVRTRNAFFEAVIRALKRHRVPVAGADRLDVGNHIAVMDLVAAGRAALLPSDDLSLACLLKSPLLGFTDDDLIALAPRREGALIDALGASGEPHHREAHARVLDWSMRATDATPFAFYSELLGRDGGRRLMEARLGPEAHDAIDEFLRLALIHEQQGAPSLGAFLADVEALDASIKRDMEGASDTVRVMTVHAAKGLEAKIVFLPDTCGVPSQRFDPTIFDLNKDQGSDRAKPPVLVWSPRKVDDTPEIDRARSAERQATMREYRRLLYVALTRAEERLYIAGFYNAKAPPPDCWANMIAATFPEADDVAAFWSDDDIVRRIVTSGSGDGTRLPPATDPQGVLQIAPGWLSQPVAAVATPTKLRPSAHAANIGADRETGTACRDAMAYGTALHLLLQYLPGRQPAERAAAGRAFLATRNATIDPATHDALMAEARAVMDLPALAALFGPDARAEVAVIGRAADGSLVNGTVDRLVVTQDAVIVADFKTGPVRAEVPAAYARQMALYADVLAPLWPGRTLRLMLVWTSAPRVVELASP